MPARSQRQRRFMAADLTRVKKGQKSRTGMSESKLEEFVRTTKASRKK